MPTFIKNSSNIFGLNPVEQIFQIRNRKWVVIRVRGSVSGKTDAAQIGKVKAECGDLIWYNCRQWAAPATELPPRYHHISAPRPAHERGGRSRTAAPCASASLVGPWLSSVRSFHEPVKANGSELWFDSVLLFATRRHFGFQLRTLIVFSSICSRSDLLPGL